MTQFTVDNFGFLLTDATRLLRKRFEARGSAHGLSSSQWRLLANVVREGEATQARLAELLEIEPISVSRLVDRMEQAGWVERRADRADRRVRLVAPTARARDAYSTLKGMASEIYREAMDGLDEAQRSALIAALATIVENLSRDTCREPHAANQNGR